MESANFVGETDHFLVFEDSAFNMSDEKDKFSVCLLSIDNAKSIYVAYTGLVDMESGRIEDQSVVAVNNPGLLSIKPAKSTFQDVRNACQEVKYQAKQIVNLTIKLDDLFTRRSTASDFIEPLLNYLKQGAKEKVAYMYEQVINEAAGNSNPDIQVWFKEVSDQEVQETSGDEASALEGLSGQSGDEIQQKSEGSQLGLPEGSSVIRFKYLLSPVSGKALVELKQGERVMIQLDAMDPKAIPWIESLQLRKEDGSLKPVPASIVKTTTTGANTESLVQIAPNLYGRHFEEENSVKVKLYIPGAKPGQVGTGRPSGGKTESSGLPFTILIAVGATALVGLALYFFAL